MKSSKDKLILFTTLALIGALVYDQNQHQEDNFLPNLSPDLTKMNKSTLDKLNQSLTIQIESFSPEENLSDPSKLSGILTGINNKVPQSEEIKAFYEQNKHRYKGDYNVSFEHLAFPFSIYGSEAVNESKKKLVAIDEKYVGKLFTGVMRESLNPKIDVEKIFGYGFALRLEERIANLDSQKSPHWIGPIMGKDGVYLVKVKSFKISPATPLLEIYEEVKNDWLLEQIDN